MKTFDKLFLNGVTIALLTVVFYLIVKNPIAAAFIAYLVWIVLRTAFIYVTNRKHIVFGNISVGEMENVFSVWGAERQAQFLFSLFPAYYSPVLTGNVIRFMKNHTEILVVCNYKFSPTGCEDVAKLYRENESATPKKIYVLGRAPAKNVLILANELPIDISFLPSRKLRRILIDHNALPKSIEKKKTEKRPNGKEVFSRAFDTGRIKYYFFLSVIFALYGLLNIYRVWYLLFSALMLLLAFLCLISYFLQKKNR
ncbi:MAG: hypothetical protein J5774_04380 [Clostridia bacterium]|nr:hypothetical protein [Clostridia bacterium]